MDGNTKRKVVAGAVGALLLAMAVGAAGAIAASRALSGDEETQRVEQIDRDEYPRPMPDLGPRGDFERPFKSFAPPALFGGLDDAATYLGLSEDELLERIRDGQTLAEIAEDEGKRVAGLVDAMVATAEEKIDEAVESGLLPEELADELKQDLEQRITDLVNSELGGSPFGFGFHDYFPGFVPEELEPRDHYRERGPRA